MFLFSRQQAQGVRECADFKVLIVSRHYLLSCTAVVASLHANYQSEANTTLIFLVFGSGITKERLG